MKKWKTIYEVVKNAVSLDIYDMNYLIGSERLGKSRKKLRNGLPPNGYVRRVISFCLNFLRSLRFIKLHPGHKNFSGQIMFFAGSQNQKDCFQLIKQEINSSYFAGGHVRFPVDVDIYFPYILAYILSLFFIPILLIRFSLSKGYQRESYIYGIDAYLLTYGLYIVSWYWLQAMNPILIVLSNDHLASNRVLTKVASQKGIKTVYIQHASVTEEFPPLSFDFAFLEGRDSLNKYERAGNSLTKIFLVGMSKSDLSLKYMNSNERVGSIGICTNMLDTIPKIEEVSEQLRLCFPSMLIYLRPHPQEKRIAVIKEIARKHNLILSYPGKEKAFDFLRRVDTVIAGNSNILLEAALMNVVPLKFVFSPNDLDWYGFEKSGLVKKYLQPEDLILKIQNLIDYKEPARMKAKVYCDTIGTEYDGRSSQIAADLIDAIIMDKIHEKKKWKRIENTFLEAYELGSIRN